MRNFYYFHFMLHISDITSEVYMARMNVTPPQQMAV